MCSIISSKVLKVFVGGAVPPALWHRFVLIVEFLGLTQDGLQLNEEFCVFGRPLAAPRGETPKPRLGWWFPRLKRLLVRGGEAAKLPRPKLGDIGSCGIPCRDGPRAASGRRPA
mmetsp:Transcript_31463/g.68590  ORF Transcript_31463/g.68590 Transcript_31463/m.68590 type:complete len:114 (-) Transcript_31463:815-1156(-)